MLDAPRTPGETVFEKYLKLQHIPFEFEKEHQGKSKRPDHTIEWEERPPATRAKGWECVRGILSVIGIFRHLGRVRELH